MGLLTDKVVVITGSGRGIGKETAKICANEGARVVVNDIDPEPALETVEEIRKNGGQATAYIGDISDESAAADLINLAKNAFGKIDALVNNAGITRDALLVRMETEKWDEIMRVHLRGGFFMHKKRSSRDDKTKNGWSDNKSIFSCRFERKYRTSKLFCCESWTYGFYLNFGKRA